MGVKKIICSDRYEDGKSAAAASYKAPEAENARQIASSNPILTHCWRKTMNLVRNVGKKDRNIRFAAGGVAIVLGIITGQWWLDIVGLILLATAYFGTCVAYLPLGVDTSKEDSAG
jgi:hypothetical protein